MNILFSIAFITGLAGSFHCIGMCGPIALALPVGRMNIYQATFHRFLYNLGRILTYSILGGAFGYFGKTLFVAGFQQQLSIMIGLIMLYFILPKRVFIWSPFQKMTHLFMSAFKKVFPINSPLGFILLGLLNGLLPCGFVYMALAGACATTTPIEGAIFMFFFGLGTAPMMFSLSILPKFLSNKKRLFINRYLPFYTFVLATFFILRGLNLGIPYLSPQFKKQEVSQTIPVCHSLIKN
jgi:sulfite exporter TauE/SafE